MKKAVSGKPKILEKEFQLQVIQLAKLCGWMVAHFRPARVMRNGKETYRTAMSGDVGFPDIVLARDGKAYLRELKTDRGTVSETQQAWLIESGGKVWRPENWPEIEAFLRQ